jgi:hypothetical protein
MDGEIEIIEFQEGNNCRDWHIKYKAKLRHTQIDL